jgi:hypothetical protein
LPGRFKFYQGSIRNLARRTFNRNLRNKISLNEKVEEADTRKTKAVDLDNHEESIDPAQVLQEKLVNSYKKAARQDIKYLRSIETYRKRVNEMNMVSKAELA